MLRRVFFPFVLLMSLAAAAALTAGRPAAGGALATAVGLRPTLWTIALLGTVLAAGALAWSPVRRYRALPAAAE